MYVLHYFPREKVVQIHGPLPEGTSGNPLPFIESFNAATMDDALFEAKKRRGLAHLRDN